MRLRNFPVLALMLTVFLSPTAHANDGAPDSTELFFSADADKNRVTINVEVRDRVEEIADSVANEVVVDSPSEGVANVTIRHYPQGDDLLCYQFETFDQTCSPDEHQPVTEDEGEGVAPLDVLYSAVEHIRIDGAGLSVNRSDWGYLGLPTLVYASTPSVETSVELLGLSIPVHLQAREFEYDFHNGAKPLVTTDPGAPYPYMKLKGYFQREQDDAYVTLTTTWDATLTHPVSGDVITIEKALTTIENSNPIKVIKRRARLTTENPHPHH